MRDFTKVSPTLWRSQKVKALGFDDHTRLLYLYLLTNPHANSAGCYDLPAAYACADLGWQEIAYRKAIERLLEVGLIAFDEAFDTLLITNWVTFNKPTNPKHALGILDQLDDASSASLKALRLEEFKAAIVEKGWDRDRQFSVVIHEAIERLSKGYRKAIATKTETETQTEKETKTRPRPDLDLVARASEPDAGLAAAPDGAARPSDPEQGIETDTELLAKLPDHLNTPFMRRQR